MLMVDGRGKQGGQVASKNRFGPYLRNKVTPVNRNTSFQAAVRAAFGSFASGWSGTLSEAERQSWMAFSALNPFTNIFGDKRFLTGQNSYIQANAALANAGLTAVTDPPTTTQTGIIGDIVLAAASGGGGTLTLTTNEVDVDAGSKIQVYATPLLSEGINFVKSELRYIGTFASAGSPYNIKAAWVAKFGTFPAVAGKKIFVAAQILTTQGVLSVPSITADVVA